MLLHSTDAIDVVCCNVFIVGFEQISHITLVLLVDCEQVNTGQYVNGNNQRITLETFLAYVLHNYN